MSATTSTAAADPPEEPPQKPHHSEHSEKKEEHKKEHASHKEHHHEAKEKQHAHGPHHHEHTNGGPAAPRRLKVCILQSSYEETTSVFKEVDPYAVPHRWLPDCDVTSVLVRKSTALMQVRDLAKLNFDMYVNLCDGAWDEDRAGIEVVRALERFRLPFTGASASFYEPSKELMKMAAYYAGVDTSPFVFAYNDADVEEAARLLKFPVIVKHYNGGGSIGMTKDSRCPDAAQLRVMAKKMIDTYGGALIEEFVDGREFTVLVAENPEDARNPIAFVPVEVAFPAGETFKHFDLKWIDYNGMTWKAVEDVALADKLKDMGRKVFLSLQGDSYARADIRMDRDGRLFFLEINPYCGCFYAPECPGSADCILQYDPIGHAGFLKLLFRSALTRQQRISGGERIGIKYRPGTGYGLVALRDIAAGELVEPYEEKAHYLVTKSHVDRSWDKQQKEWFEAYAYPLIGETYVMWSDKPTDWKPLNHGCEPNTWLVGLNQVAKRDIKQGEALSIEYATFCGLNMKEFQCLCGAPSCRRTIKPTDFLQPWVSERYSGHLSCYVREQRLAKGLPV